MRVRNRLANLVSRAVTRRDFWPEPRAVRTLPRVWAIPEHKLAYVHIPKTGTRSVRAALAAFLLGGDAADEEIRDKIAKASEQYERLAAPEEIAELSTDYLTFGFVRNPLDRLYSAYRDKVVGAVGSSPQTIFERHGIRTGTTFADFVRRVADLSDEESDRHLCSQSHFLYASDRLVVSYLGTFERLDECWTQLAEGRGFPGLPRRNISGAEDYREVYTAELARVVARRYERDIEAFGYGHDVAELLR